MNKKIIKFLWEYLKDYKGKYLLGGILVILASLIGVLTGYLNGVSLDKIASSEFKLAILALVIYLICSYIKSFARKYSNIIFQKVD